jgi:hypothetical protein
MDYVIDDWLGLGFVYAGIEIRVSFLIMSFTVIFQNIEP